MDTLKAEIKDKLCNGRKKCVKTLISIYTKNTSNSAEDEGRSTAGN